MYTGFVTSLCLRNSEKEGRVGAVNVHSSGSRVSRRTRFDIIIPERTHLEGKCTVSPQHCPV